MTNLQSDAKRPWSEIVQEKQLRDCVQCLACISGVGDRSYGRLPSRSNPVVCECCEPGPELKEWSDNLSLSEKMAMHRELNADRSKAGYERMGWKAFVEEQSYFARMREISKGWTNVGRPS